MKKNYLFITALLVVTAANAQPVITGASNTKIGDVYQSHAFDASSFDPGDNSANTTWDFSAITSSGATTWTLKAASSHPSSSKFPLANTVLTEGSGTNSTFTIFDNTSYSIVGFEISSPSVEEKYTDPREVVKFPITHGGVFNETFSGTHKNSGFTYNRAGTIKIEGDGYGTLILPYTTVKNCLRVKIVTEYGDKLSGSTVADYVDEAYYWYHPDLNVILLKYHDLTVVGAPGGTKVGEYADESLVGINHPDFERHEISVYPQPASNVLNINYDLSQSTDVRIRLTDIAGRDVHQEVVLNNQQTVKESIDISGLQAGVYVVQMVLNNSQVLTKKIIVH